MPPRVIKNSEQAIEVLGGVPAVARLLGKKRTAVANWLKRGLPPEACIELGKRLRQRRYKYDEHALFKQYKAADDGSKP